jgi:hypothetical protein
MVGTDAPPWPDMGPAPPRGRTRIPGSRWFDMDREREPLEFELLRALARPRDPDAMRWFDEWMREGARLP